MRRNQNHAPSELSSIVGVSAVGFPGEKVGKLAVYPQGAARVQGSGHGHARADTGRQDAVRRAEGEAKGAGGEGGRGAGLKLGPV